MYLIYGKDQYLIEEELNKNIQKLNKNKEFEIFKFSLISDSCDLILSEIENMSFFSNKKIIVINDCFFLNESKVKLHKNNNDEKITKLLNSKENEDIKVILVLNSEKVSKKLKIAKNTVEKSTVIEVKNLSFDQKLKFAVEILRKNEISYQEKALQLFIDKTNYSMGVLNTELNKILILKKELTLEYVVGEIKGHYEFDVFELSNTFLQNNPNDFLKLFKQYIEINNDMIGLIAILINNFSTLRNIMILKNRGISNYEIASSLELNPYRVSKLLESKTVNIQEINKNIKKLYLLNYNIIDGKVDSKIIPEIELLQLFKGV